MKISPSQLKKINIVLTIVMILFGYWVYHTIRYPKPSEIYNEVVRSVSSELKCPSTAKFEPYGYGWDDTDADGTFDISSYVDSQNEYGATVRTEFDASGYVDASGEVHVDNIEWR